MLQPLSTGIYVTTSLACALSYAAIFSFISGSSFVLIEILGVPIAGYGYCFACGVTGYLLGTIVCRRLLGRFGLHARCWPVRRSRCCRACCSPARAGAGLTLVTCPALLAAEHSAQRLLQVAWD